MVTRPGAALFHRRSGPIWNCAEVATEYLPWLLQVACTGRVAYQSDRSMVPTAIEDALAEGRKSLRPGRFAAAAVKA
jgi:hypothetical protein